MKKTLFLLTLILVSCGGTKETTSELTDPVLTKKALEEGNRISSLAQQALGSNLMQQVKQNGPEEAVDFCNLAAYPILDTIHTGLNVKIKRAAIKARNEKDLPETYEKEIIEKYELALKNKQPVKPIVQALGANEVLYAAPIKTKNEMCLNCHGNEIDQISEATLARINSLYPNDQATGHSVGDLRGIWSIRFNKEELANYAPKKDLALDGLQLLKQNCYSCHDPNSKDHDLVIAPPLEGIKRRYLANYGSVESAKSNMISFLNEPTKEKSIMKGPVKRFGLMPKFQWSEEVTQAMVDYIYANQLAQPEWFEAHYQEMHGE